MCGEMMNFPETVGEFMEDYKIVDTQEVYSNGVEFVPIFRMKQWFDHENKKDRPNYEAELADLRKYMEKQKAEIAYLNELLRDSEKENVRLKGQMEIVYLIFGGKTNG